MDQNITSCQEVRDKCDEGKLYLYAIFVSLLLLVWCVGKSRIVALQKKYKALADQVDASVQQDGVPIHPSV